MLGGIKQRKVCIDLNCTEIFKVVYPNSHNNHHSITVNQLQDQLTEWLGQRNYKCTDLCKDYLISNIKQNFDQLKVLLDKFEQALINSYYQQINLKNYEIIVNQLKSINYQKVNLLKDEDLNEIMSIRHKEDYIEQLIIIKNEIECKAHKSFMCFSKNIRSSIQELELTCNIIEPSSKQSIINWSEQMKSDHIELLKENTQAIHASFKNDCMVLSDFQMNCNGISSMAVKINNPGYFVALGLANYKTQQIKAFSWDMNFLKGSGLFLLINNGQTFLDTSAVFNMDGQPFTYDENDIINVIYNATNENLKLQKNDQSITIRIRQNVKELRFCACLYGASVEIVQ